MFTWSLAILSAVTSTAVSTKRPANSSMGLGATGVTLAAFAALAALVGFGAASVSGKTKRSPAMGASACGVSPRMSKAVLVMPLNLLPSTVKPPPLLGVEILSRLTGMSLRPSFRSASRCCWVRSHWASTAGAGSCSRRLRSAMRASRAGSSSVLRTVLRSAEGSEFTPALPSVGRSSRVLKKAKMR